MNLDELQTARDRERQTDKLQQLRASFYADAGEFIQQLHTERERAAERADDPFDSPEVSRLSDEIGTAEQTVEAIYEKRVGKLVKAASFAAADLPAEVDGMTAEEEELFDTLVADIKRNREYVLAVLAGEDEGAPPDAGEPAPHPDVADRSGQDDGDGPPRAAGDGRPPADESRTRPPAESEGGNDFTAAAMGGDGPDRQASTGQETTAEPPQQARQPEDGGQGNEPGNDRREPETGKHGGQTGNGGQHARGAAEASAGPAGSAESATDDDIEGRTAGGTEVERETVRITSDVGTFVGYDDREYDLAENDIVQLPETNAGPLLERGVAEKLDF